MAIAANATLLTAVDHFDDGQNDDDDNNNNNAQRFHWQQRWQRQTAVIGWRCCGGRPGGQRLPAGRLFRLLPIGDDRGSSDGDAQRIVVQQQSGR